MMWLGSGSKIVTVIACLQLAEKGLISLDNPEDVNKWLSELKNYFLISKDTDPENGRYVLKPKTKAVTLRHLLNHQAGFGYPIFEQKLKYFANNFGIDWVAKNSIHLPLVHEPGEGWTYGVGIDWAGIMISRVLDKPLETIFQENIFEPLGIKHVTMRPSKDDYAHRVMECATHDKKTNKIYTIPHLYGDSLSDSILTNEAHKDFGGSGLFAQPSEYIKIFATILNNGVSPHTGSYLLSEKSIEEMFTNQFPEIPMDTPRTPMGSLDPGIERHPKLLTNNGLPPRNWGLSWFLNPEKFSTGRSANSAFWCGFGHIFYWVDRERDVTGFVGSSLISNPFPDYDVWKLFGEFETEVYNGLEDSKVISPELIDSPRERLFSPTARL
jgi:CubicO group peptidase (beta-lactamase class C family)